MKEIIRLTVMILLLLTVVCAVCLVVSAKDKQETKEKVGYIFIGDSRTAGMNDVIHMDEIDDTFVVSKTSAGYEWYMQEGSKEVYDIRCAHPEYTRWIYVFNLGINDPDNIESYKNLYRELSYEATLYYVSLNPLNEDIDRERAEGVYEFNKKLREAVSDEDYINSYDYLLKVSGFNFIRRSDGINYDEETYKTLYDFIMMAIDVHEFVRVNDNRYSAYYYLYNVR